ncbi:hypothetical protein PM082_009191 [Marasmius tenuissimus]|nr:hypothetical protein PM082_009191 [Marasmius tenuissimus]
MVGPESKFKFDLIKWDGTTTIPFIDEEDRVVLMCVGYPNNRLWMSVPQRLAVNVEQSRKKVWFKKKNRRGPFGALQSGVSFGMGMKARKPAVHRQSSIANHQAIQSLLKDNYHNRCDGFCAITPLSPPTGGYDYCCGGHLIVWDLKIVIEFPPGTTILLPSAIFRHSNVAIGKSEKRYSITQYSAGSLFRWVEHGFQLEDSFYDSLTPDELELERRKDDGRWEQALNNFLKLSKLLKL